ncbi:MAG: hypothetical protein ABH828_01995 [archaeon]
MEFVDTIRTKFTEFAFKDVSAQQLVESLVASMATQYHLFPKKTEKPIYLLHSSPKNKQLIESAKKDFVDVYYTPHEFSNRFGWIFLDSNFKSGVVLTPNHPYLDIANGSFNLDIRVMDFFIQFEKNEVTSKIVQNPSVAKRLRNFRKGKYTIDAATKPEERLNEALRIINKPLTNTYQVPAKKLENVLEMIQTNTPPDEIIKHFYRHLL